MSDPNDAHRQQQIAWNRQTIDGWSAFEEHRAQIARLLTVSAEMSTARIAVLGAGNCNDLPLNDLLRQFASIQLIDWDRGAVLAGVERQGFLADDRVVVAESVDLNLPSDDETCFDCVASVGLLSQLMLPIANDATLHSRERIAAVEALRRSHFEAMLSRLVPGGVGVLTFEFVSSATLPELATCNANTFASTVEVAVQSGNFFTGLHPAAVARTASILSAAGRIEAIEHHRPWKWNFGPRVYAVAALRFRKAE